MSVQRKTKGNSFKNSRRVSREWATLQTPDASNPKVVRGCISKKQYRQKHRVIAAASRNGKKHGVRFDFYRCKACRGFHLRTVKAVPEVPAPPEVTTSIPPTRTLAGVTVRTMVKRVEA